jgi:hypothetical protein
MWAVSGLPEIFAKGLIDVDSGKNDENRRKVTFAG